VAYGAGGYTHHAVEDLAVMRAMSNMTVLAPGDPVEVRLATRAVVNWQGPCYLRLGKGSEPIAHQIEPAFAISKAIVVRDGNDVTLICTGGILSEVVVAAEQLAPQIQARVLSMPTVKPLDQVALLKAASETKLLVTVEEHSAVGGLGSAVAQVLAETGNTQGRLRMLNLGEQRVSAAGTQSFLREQMGLSGSSVAGAIQRELSNLDGAVHNVQGLC
jgi:transketolase